jgi:hypothetical protein
MQQSLHAPVTGPTLWNLLIGRSSTKFDPMLGVMTNSPSGLRWSDASLAKNLLSDTPADAVSSVSFRIAVLYGGGNGGRRAKVEQRCGDIEICLIERQRLDQIGCSWQISVWIWAETAL